MPAELIKTGGPALITEIYRLCNMIWQEEEWPEQWTKSILVTIPKKGDLTDCANYRTIALITHLSKILLLVILKRLTVILEECLSQEQAGFRKDRSTIQQILTLRLIAEKYLERDGRVYNCFIDYTKAFDSVWHDGLWAVLRNYRAPEKLITLLQNLYAHSQLAVKVGVSLGDWLMAEIGNRQGDPISPLLFISLLVRVMEATECNRTPSGINVHGMHSDKRSQVCR